MAESVDCVVIGAGVVGLACARALALQGREVIILERAEAIGTETSSRHSEVIHAGIYYEPGSLKARFCVEGKLKMYCFMKERGIPYNPMGKLIVATSEHQVAGLQSIKDRAEKNGVMDLELLSHNEVVAREPELRCITALWSPSTGVADSHSYMLGLQGDAEDKGAMIAYFAPVERGEITDGGIILEVGGEGAMTLNAKTVINAAGLHTQKLTHEITGFPKDRIPPWNYCKGNYYSLSGCKAPFSSLIYPAPEQAGLGVHLTLDLAGQARFGPDVEWIDEINYDVDPGRSDSFYAAVRKYWPGLPDGALQPGYSGIRPKIQASGEPATDYVIHGPKEHGVPGLINLYAIESPGMTSSLAIADYVADMLEAE
ncbi:MAG: NAD(P)/FAD-dependent oxidoreductase [Alphaproteobacteria bacterium]|nr:NAD(P)/FAD-dependent oxidoreductase [Alphaproteobacteria bacterium]